jgi:hypothetical protein
MWIVLRQEVCLPTLKVFELSFDNIRKTDQKVKISALIQLGPLSSSLLTAFSSS